MPEFNTIVLGTGAAGLAAAITAHEQGARVAIFEKSDLVGGTSAWSGGQVWIPNNRQMRELGKKDSAEEAVTYLMSMSNGLIDRQMAEVFVETGPRMVEYFETRTPVKFMCVADFPDYHPEQPGGKPGGGRTLECPMFPFGELGPWADRVTVSPYWPTVRMTVGETTLCQAIPQEIAPEEATRRVAQDERGMGVSLIGRLLRGCLDRGIEPQVKCRAIELVMEKGSVAGVKFEGAEETFIVAAKNVILATGGFDWDPELTRAFLRGPLDRTVAIPSNTGDGLRMAMRVGAMLGNMREAWWMPVVDAPVNSAGRILFTAERTLPGSIMVNKAGRRFTNEAANYNAFGAAFHEQETNSCSYANLPCWVVFDQQFYNKYGFAGGYGDAGERQTERIPPEWVLRGNTLGSLADRLGIPDDALEATVERWNTNVAAGHDPDFRRGESWYDRWWGDPNCKGKREATLGRIGAGPYYAVEVKSGAIGTKGGPRTDIDARVLNVDGKPIEGLYAVGNVMASPMGMTYGGGGGTLGPAMVFGYRAGMHAGARAASAQLSAAPPARTGT